ncbi:MAG TPA: hypothetical protein VEL47_02835 [Myxococcota bacterium]|nr:hypothetical protein [Myxococcota bacterium]
MSTTFTEFNNLFLTCCVLGFSSFVFAFTIENVFYNREKQQIDITVSVGGECKEHQVKLMRFDLSKKNPPTLIVVAKHIAGIDDKSKVKTFHKLSYDVSNLIKPISMTFYDYGFKSMQTVYVD